VSVGFSGSGRKSRVVKAEIYVQDITKHLRFQELLRAIDADEPWVRPLWAGVRDGVHRHPRASRPDEPGVYALAGATRMGTASIIPPAGVLAHPSAPLGRSPSPAPDSVGIERAGDAGRIVTFLDREIDVRNPGDVEAAGVWMAATLPVFRSVLG
jgi:hypothetical protein